MQQHLQCIPLATTQPPRLTGPTCCYWCSHTMAAAATAVVLLLLLLLLLLLFEVVRSMRPRALVCSGFSFCCQCPSSTAVAAAVGIPSPAATATAATAATPALQVFSSWLLAREPRPELAIMSNSFGFPVPAKQHPK